MDLGQHVLYSQLSQERALKDLIPNGEQRVRVCMGINDF